MFFERFIAGRLLHSVNEHGRTGIRPMIRLTITGIAISLCVMLLSVSIMQGFKAEVKGHAYSLSGRMTLYPYGAGIDGNEKSITLSPELRQLVLSIPQITDATPVVRQVGVLKTDSTYLGMQLMGIDSLLPADFFRKNMRMGHWNALFAPHEGVTPILLPKAVTDLLELNLGDKVKIYFMGSKIRVRPFEIVGIYESGTTAEKSMAFCPLRLLQRTNGWAENQFSALVLNTKPEASVEKVCEEVIATLQSNPKVIGNQEMGINTAEELYPVIFGWLDMLDGNVALLMVLMLLVAGFTMITGLIIMVLNRTQLIGILKALGADNRSVRNIFMRLSAVLVIKGLLWGNAAALLLCLIQHNTHIIKLNPETYFMDAVPIHIHLPVWLAINVGAVVLILLIVWGPTRIIARIRPSDTMRFE